MMDEQSLKKEKVHHYGYLTYPCAEKCFYCGKPIDQWSSYRVLKDLKYDCFRLEDICFTCIPDMRPELISK